MRYKMKLISDYNRLEIHNEPNFISKVVTHINGGTTILTDDVKVVKSSIWYHLENNTGWICGYNSDLKETYLVIVQELEEKFSSPIYPPGVYSRGRTPIKKEIKVICGNLWYRAGPGMHTAGVGVVKKGYTSICSEQEILSDGGLWMKWADDNTWSSFKGASGTYYMTIVKDLQPPPPPKPPAPPPAPKPPTPPNYGAIQDQLNRAADIRSSNINNGDFIVQAGEGKTSSEPLKDTGMGRAEVRRDSFETYNDSSMNENLDRVRKNLNIMNGSGYTNITEALFSSFDRFKTPNVDYHLSKSYSHIFFTRPDLNLVNGDKLAPQVQNDPLYYYLFKNNPKILSSLTNGYSAKHDFNPYLGNTAQSFEVSDEFIKTIEHGETFTGYKMQYGTSNIESRTAGNFSIAYTDDKDYTIYKIHKAWVEYISKVFRGELVPKTEYKFKKILDYACSVYYFVLGEDMETILFWTKYYGVFPTNIPASTSSWSKGNLLRVPEYNINYSYSFKEDFTPLSLAEFNMNSKSSGVQQYRAIYEPENGATGRTFANAPFVETVVDPSTKKYIFKLKFKHE